MTFLPSASVVTLLVLGAIGAGCSSPAKSSGFDGPGGGGGGGGGGDGGSGGGSIGGDSGGGTFGMGGGGSDAGPASDGAIGPVDVSPACDGNLGVADPNAASFAKAIGICKSAGADGYGLVSASYSRAYGSSTPPAAGQWGLLPKFGSVVKPREGATLGVISSGFAREYDNSSGTPSGMSADFVSSGSGPMDGTAYPTGQAPPGFPKAAQGCPQDNLVNDMVDVKLVLKAPPDATGFQFDFDFFSSEWPNYVCSNFNDAFAAYLTSQATKDNISFDANHNPVAVNINFFDRCTAGAPVGCLRSNGPNPDPPLSTSTCSAGPSELGGTGFGDTFSTQCGGGDVDATLGGSTGWLTTKAPISPGEQFTLEFMIWDAGDGALDSSVLIDHFQWLGGSSVTTGTGRNN